MKIAIVGPAERTHAWENHLRPHHIISQVIIAPSLDEIGDVKTCLLLDDSQNRLANMLKAVKQGMHTFFISSLPLNKSFAQAVYHAAQEANVCTQFSHWPTLAPASRWMRKQVPRPSFIQINRELKAADFSNSETDFESLWSDELAYCLKYIGSGVHHFDVNVSRLPSHKVYAIHLNLRFESGANAAIFVSRGRRENIHSRFVSNQTTLLYCNVENQTIYLGREDKEKNFYQRRHTFDASRAAEDAITQFLKSIHMASPSLYSSYDLLQFCETRIQINDMLKH